jgi:hypothetical protein
MAGIIVAEIAEVAITLVVETTEVDITRAVEITDVVIMVVGTGTAATVAEAHLSLERLWAVCLAGAAAMAIHGRTISVISNITDLTTRRAQITIAATIMAATQGATTPIQMVDTTTDITIVGMAGPPATQ